VFRTRTWAQEQPIVTSVWKSLWSTQTTRTTTTTELCWCHTVLCRVQRASTVLFRAQRMVTTTVMVMATVMVMLTTTVKVVAAAATWIALEAGPALKTTPRTRHPHFPQQLSRHRAAALRGQAPRRVPSQRQGRAHPLLVRVRRFLCRRAGR
jgi:hypothetical protein